MQTTISTQINEAASIADTFCSASCSLCDAPLPACPITEGDLAFCCPGCHVVYQLLAAKGQLQGYAQDPLFLQAVQSGLISNPALLEQIRQQRSSLIDGEREKFYVEIADMWCPACSEIIKLLLMKQKGVINCVVDYASDLCCVEYSPRYLSKEDVLNAITSFGYTAAPLDSNARKAVTISLYIRFGVAAFCALNVMMLAYPLYATYFSYDGEGYGPLFAWISLIVSLPVVTYCAWPIWRRLSASLKTGLFGMEILVAIGVWTAFGLSAFELYEGGTRVYFDTMTVIIAFVLLGKIVEARAKFSAKESLFRLSRSIPRKGRKRLYDGTLGFVSVKEIVKGDVVEVFAGEKIPLDGKVLSGEGACDESLMTGEAMPLSKKVGSGVLGGSVLVQGNLSVEVMSSSEETALHKIIEMVERDIGHKTTYLRAVDHIVTWFVPAIVVFAALTGVLTWMFSNFDTEEALMRAIAVLLISCPCAIGIAAPTAESHLLNGLAALGAIVRNRGCLIYLGKETTFIFDKTGTATEGIFAVQSGLEILSREQRSVLHGLAVYSTHPIACAIARAIEEPPTQFDKLQEIAGFGMIGSVDGKHYAFGSLRLMQQQGISFSECGQSTCDDVIYTNVYFGEGKHCLSHLILGDKIRPDLPQLIESLKPAKKVLLSGDTELPVRAVAKACGFDEWHSGRSPLEKREYIENLKNEGAIVCMIGDGINDAPALTAAHVGVSVVSATDISMQVSDLLLTTDRLEVITRIQALARFGRRIITQNLFWAFFYNIIGIFLAAFGLLSPIFAAFAMAASSLTVLLNARRLSGNMFTSPE